MTEPEERLDQSEKSRVQKRINPIERSSLLSRLWAWLGDAARRFMNDRDDDDDDGMRIAINMDESFDKPDDEKSES